MKHTMTGRRMALVTATVGVTLMAAGAFTASTVGAAVGVCRSDPAFNLSNGETVTLYETLTDNPSDVLGGLYVLHIPKGISVTSVDYSGTLGTEQGFTYYADEPAGVYTAESTVLTRTSKLPVTAYMTYGTGLLFESAPSGPPKPAPPGHPPGVFPPTAPQKIKVTTSGQPHSTFTVGQSNVAVANKLTVPAGPPHP